MLYAIMARGSPLIQEVREAHTRVTQPWYADDAEAGGRFKYGQVNFQDLQARGPARGYYPEPTKSILVVVPGNVDRAEEHFRWIGIQVVTGNMYLGVFLGDAEAER